MCMGHLVQEDAGKVAFPTVAKSLQKCSKVHQYNMMPM